MWQSYKKKNKKIFKAQFTANKILNDKIEGKNIIRKGPKNPNEPCCDTKIIMSKANWIKLWSLIIKQLNIEGQDNSNSFQN
jgi:hypothetical protein